MNTPSPPVYYLRGGQVSQWNAWRREQLSSGSETPRVVDLTGVSLQMTNLVGADLANANLTRARLSNADLTDADLTGANLTEASLLGATLRNATLAYANATEADLTEANLNDADLISADLTRARLDGAELIRADLTNTDLTDAVLTEAVIPLSSRNQARNAYVPMSRSPRRRTAAKSPSTAVSQSVVFPELPPSAAAAVRLTIPTPPRVEPAHIASVLEAVNALSRVSLMAADLHRPWGQKPGTVAVLTGSPEAAQIEVQRLGYGSPVVIELLETLQGAAPHVTAAAAVWGAYRARSVLVEALLTICRKAERDRYFQTRTIRAERKKQEEALRLKEVNDGLTTELPGEIVSTSQLEIASTSEDELHERLRNEDTDQTSRDLLEPILPQLAALLENGLTATVTESVEKDDPEEEVEA